MEPLIRRAEVADAEAGAWCHVNCWREAYAGVIDPARLADTTNDVDRRIAKWTDALAVGVVRWIALNPDPEVAVTDRVIGFSSPGPSRDEDAPTPLELYAIYVRQGWWGTGLGSRLLEVAIGSEPASLWVLEDNPRAGLLQPARVRGRRGPRGRAVLRRTGDPDGPALTFPDGNTAVAPGQRCWRRLALPRENPTESIRPIDDGSRSAHEANLDGDRRPR